MSDKTKFIFKLLVVIFAGLFLIFFMINVVSDMVSNHYQIEFNKTQTKYYQDMLDN